MTHAKLVMSSAAYRNKSKCGRRRYVHLTVKGSALTVYGHTWNEAFRRAAITLVTARLSH